MKNVRLLVGSALCCFVLLSLPALCLATGDQNNCGSESQPDSCGVCDGGDKDKDCFGDCFGNGKEDPAGACCYNFDCSGYCGNKKVDDCGVCGGNNQNMNSCGMCFQPESACCPEWAVRNIRYSSNAGVTFHATSQLPACAIPYIQQAAAQCKKDEGCWNAKFGGQLNPSGTGFILFNSSCQVIGSKSGNNSNGFVRSECIVATVRHDSPISLLFGEELDAEIVYTQFPLNPTADGKWYEWRASKNAPLLVYDPEHKGTITTASQLFGNWTFGGQRTASLESNSAATPWKNGYDALATLDHDGNGKIEGAELAPLGLWFDENRDAISQPGEVKPISATDVTALFYKSSHTNKRSGNIYADVGYERTVDGNTVVGRSVDWYAAGAKSRSLLRAHAGFSKVESVDLSDSVVQFLESQVPASEREELSSRHSPITGLYQWKENGNHKDSSQGLLYLFETDKGVLKGYTIVEMDVASEMTAKSKVHSVMTISPIEGTIERGDEAFKMSFKVKSGGEADTQTTMTMPLDQSRMEGKSSTTLPAVAGESESFSYQWTGERVE